MSGITTSHGPTPWSLKDVQAIARTRSRHQAVERLDRAERAAMALAREYVAAAMKGRRIRPDQALDGVEAQADALLRFLRSGGPEAWPHFVALIGRHFKGQASKRRIAI